MAQRLAADLVDHLLDPFPHHRAGQAQVFEAEGELGLDILEHELGIGMLKDETDARAQLPGEMRPSVQPGHGDPAAERSP